MTALGLPPGHSAAFNYGWSAQYSATVTWTDPLPRYLPGLWSGLGGHDFFFYAPLPFWFIAVLVAPLCPGCSPATEFVLGSSVLLVASGVAMFAFLRRFFALPAAAFGALVYVILPYHLLMDWFVRQAAGEFTAYAFLPLIALGMERICRQAGGGWILALGVAGTALSHLPTTLLAAHVFGALAVVLAVLQPGGTGAGLRLLARLAWFGGLGLALAAVYWLPALLLLDTVAADTLFDPYFQPWRWLYFAAEPPPNTQTALQILICFLACLPLLLGALRSARGALLAWILVPAALAVLLNTAPSAPIWREWIIAKVQFPWRMMVFVDFATAIAAAVLVSRAVDRIGKRIVQVAVLAALAPALVMALDVRYRLPGAPPDQQLDDDFAAIEYLGPELARTLRLRLDQPRLRHFDQFEVVDEVARLTAELHGTQTVPDLGARRARSFVLQPAPGASALALPVQYWALWQAQAGGVPLQARPNPTFGTLDILAPAGGFGAGPVAVTLPLQPSERAGAALSLLALLLLVATSLWRRRRPVRGAPPGADRARPPPLH